MYNYIISRIVERSGSAREKTVWNAPHTVEKAETWNREHKVLNVLRLEPDADGYRDGFQVDIVTMSICG